jgi:hypothetical protein
MRVPFLDTSTPPLENGDRLTRSEFERRYEAMPHLKKAELIEGVVYTQHRVHCRTHAEPNLMQLHFSVFTRQQRQVLM